MHFFYTILLDILSKCVYHNTYKNNTLRFFIRTRILNDWLGRFLG